MASRLEQEQEYLIEFTRLGNALRANAVDPVTLTEVSVIAPWQTRQQDLAALAVRKLRYVLNKRAKQ